MVEGTNTCLLPTGIVYMCVRVCMHAYASVRASVRVSCRNVFT